jgi:phosphatidate phosphatase APP1
LPRGPITLRDWGLGTRGGLPTDHKAHKLIAIERLLRRWPHLPCILFGDSGQQDPEIYARAAQDFPGRIRAIYIRDVTDERRDDHVRALAAQTAALGTPMLFAADTVVFAEHALAQRFSALHDT